MNDLKGDIVNQAYSLLVISGITSQPTPEELELAITELEQMAVLFKDKNICTGYVFEDDPDTSCDSGLTKAQSMAYADNLAFHLCPHFGKTPSPSLAARKRRSYSYLLASTAVVRTIQAPNTMPRGSGNTLRHGSWNRFNRPVAIAPNECATNKMYIDDIQDYVENYDDYLNGTEDISSYTLEADAGLEVVTESLSSPNINYRIKAVGGDYENSNLYQTIKVTITTTLGRVNTRVINFELNEA